MGNLGLNHVDIIVTDLQRSVAFYRKVFGLRQIRRDGDIAIVLKTPGAHDRLTLVQGDPSQPMGIKTGVRHFGFRVQADSEVDRIAGKIDAAGGTVLRRFTLGRCASIICADPDGYELEITAYDPDPVD